MGMGKPNTLRIPPEKNHGKNHEQKHQNPTANFTRQNPAQKISDTSQETKTTKGQARGIKNPDFCSE